MKSIEEKIISLKNKIDTKWASVFSFMMFGLVVVFGMEMLINYKNEKQAVQDEYNKSMYEAYSYVKNVKNELAKLEVTNSKNLVITTLSSIWSKSALAKTEMAALPLEQNNLSNASKFLTQLSDYSYSLMKQELTSNEVKVHNEKENISYLYEKIDELSDVMLEVYNALNRNSIKWDELKKIGNEKFSEISVNDSISVIAEIGKVFQKYEGLIYDGAFSDHILKIEPKFLKENECDLHQAEEYIRKIFESDNVEYINLKSESSSPLELYNFEVKLKESDFTRTISITKKDCKMYLMIGDRNVQDEKLTINEAKKAGKQFLKRLGIEDNVEDTYYLKVDNMAIINYAAVQDGVICYPDLIKVKVALDTGEVCSVESQGYIFNHENRENITPTKTIEDARSKISKDVEVMSERLAIIPTDSKDEVLVYEFKGIIEDREFLIYINADNLYEEKILVIIETPRWTSYYVENINNIKLLVYKINITNINTNIN